MVTVPSEGFCRVVVIPRWESCTILIGRQSGILGEVVVWHREVINVDIGHSDLVIRFGAPEDVRFEGGVVVPGLEYA